MEERVTAKVVSEATGVKSRRIAWYASKGWVRSYKTPNPRGKRYYDLQEATEDLKKIGIYK